MSIRNRWGCFSVVLFVALGVSVFLNLSLLLFRGGDLTPGEPARLSEEVIVAGTHKGIQAEDKIAQISVHGIITSSDLGGGGENMVEEVKAQLKQAVRDSKVKGIVLSVDSPGGEVTASDILYQEVKAARAVKPVVVYMGSLAASGGYYISCGGSHLLANETTLTGSIGVIMQSIKYYGLMEKVGVGVVTFKSGQFKDMLSGARDITPAEAEYLQKMIGQTYDKFVGIVASERKLDEAALRTGLADGRVISGKDALEAKLIDGVGTIEDAYAKAMQLSAAPGASVIRYESTLRLGKLLRMLTQGNASSRGKVELNLGEALQSKIEAGRMYYLPGFLVH